MNKTTKHSPREIARLKTLLAYAWDGQRSYESCDIPTRAKIDTLIPKLLKAPKADAHEVRSAEKAAEQAASLNQTGRAQYDAIVEMVAALECDYDRLAQLRDDRGTWESLNKKRMRAGATWGLDNPELGDELQTLGEAAGECNDQEEARQRIEEDALSLEVRTDWYSLTGDREPPSQFKILLAWGGPAAQIVGDLDEHGEPYVARLEVQDWFTPWTPYTKGVDEGVLITYCRVFSFGEG